MKEMKKLERCIKNELQRIRKQVEAGDESESVVWVIPGKLACSQRPLRDHPKFGGHNQGHTPLPPEARPLVISWVRQIEKMGIRSIICLLEERQLDHYYIRGGLDLHENGLLGYYESRGLAVRHFPMTDYQRPHESHMQDVLKAFDELPKPVLVHCSAGMDRTAPVAAFIAQQRNTGPELFAQQHVCGPLDKEAKKLLREVPN